MNLLVTYIYDLGEKFELHREIHRLCVESYERNLLGDWGHVILRGSFKANRRARRYGLMLQDVFKKLFHLRDNNLFIVDADTLCVRPVEVFGKWDRLTMFNMANARVPYEEFERDEYLHCGVRYVPWNFAHWGYMTSLALDWDYDVWAYDQYVWNKLFWAQRGVFQSRVNEYVDPRYCWCVPDQYDNLGVPEEEAFIVHFHETRGVKTCLEKMRGYDT